ncbi:hypothetical protein Q0F99_19935 [Rathayibacter oskolensis]|uniref:hypothetical protein n=1 Tax=Rathayibacter oskolensis TaxID=1891671 RepID=UPI00265F671D|nr:hypothetical protein [Rathayibacter oskolensis]WKK71564.1 hypothetical protein Q0F99_19935 [Rathayibacter oskolensis]
MGQIFDSRAGKPTFQRVTSAERAEATEYTGTADGSDPTSTQRRPLSAAELRRAMFRAPNLSAHAERGAAPSAPRS